jgi:hypothetical protein
MSEPKNKQKTMQLLKALIGNKRFMTLQAEKRTSGSPKVPFRPKI